MSREYPFDEVSPPRFSIFRMAPPEIQEFDSPMLSMMLRTQKIQEEILETLMKIEEQKPTSVAGAGGG